MVSITELLLPVVLSAVLVFIASALMWMVMPHHRNDWKSAPEGERLQELLRTAAPGQYMYPRVSTAQERKDPAVMTRLQNEPSGMLIVREPGAAMARMMALSVLQYLLISLLVGYLTGIALPDGATYGQVFRVSATAAVLGYTGAIWGKSIWWSYPWSTTLKEVFDGGVYGLLTAGVFGWLWP